VARSIRLEASRCTIPINRHRQSMHLTIFYALIIVIREVHHPHQCLVSVDKDVTPQSITGNTANIIVNVKWSAISISQNAQICLPLRKMIDG
jgi:hypothetical protein